MKTKEEIVTRIVDAATEIEEGCFFWEISDYHIDIWRDDDSENWYMQVSRAEQGYLYDSWLPDSSSEPIKSAIKQAISGARIWDDLYKYISEEVEG